MRSQTEKLENTDVAHLKSLMSSPRWYFYSISVPYSFTHIHTYYSAGEVNEIPILLLRSSRIGSALDIPQKTIYISFSVRLIESTKTVKRQEKEEARMPDYVIRMKLK